VSGNCPLRGIARTIPGHLFMSKEILSMRLNTRHNLYFYLDFFTRMRGAIEEGSFDSFKKEWDVILEHGD
jgi:queuine tRNA-ribosyltransferase